MKPGHSHMILLLKKALYAWNMRMSAFCVVIALSGLLTGVVVGVNNSSFAHSRPVVSTVQHQPTANAKPTSQPDPGAAQTVIARDTFQRSSQVYWGFATDGQRWGGDANTAPIFWVQNKVGLVGGLAGTYQAILGPGQINAEVLMDSRINQFDQGANMGVVLRWQDPDNWYKAFIDGAHLTMVKDVKGKMTQLGQTAFVGQKQTTYSFRFQAQGNLLSAKVWPKNGHEPVDWMISLSDSSLSAGQAGLRIVAQNATVVSVTSFQLAHL